MGESKVLKFVCRVKKIKSQLLITSSGQHNFREKISDNVDSTRTNLNENLGVANSAQELSSLTKSLIDEDKTLIKDAKSTKLIEFLISATPEAFEQESFDEGKYFRDALAWVGAKHGGAKNVVSAVIHRDEDTPHMHVLVVSVNEIAATTRMRSVGAKGGGRVLKEFPVPAYNRLSADTLYGGPRKLSALQDDFEAQVGKDHGLTREKRYIDGQEYIAEPHVPPREYRKELKERERVLAIKAKEIETLRASLFNREAGLDMREVDLEMAQDTLSVDQKALKTAQDVLSGGQKGLAVGQEGLEADKAKERGFLQRVMDGQEVVKTGLDEREETLAGREKVAKALEATLEDKIALHNAKMGTFRQNVESNAAKITAFQQTVAEFRKEMEPLKGYSPGQLSALVEKLQKFNVKPQGQGR